MANTYAANTFTINTSTNVAGLIALKGSAPALTDNILVVATATLTIEQNLNCRQLSNGFLAIDGASPTILPSRIVIEDNVVVTILDGERLFNGTDAILESRGTLRTIGTGTGVAGQTYPLLHVDNTAVFVNGTPWRHLPWLTGRRVTCGVTSGSSTIVVASDPRVTGLALGDVVEIRDHTTGALVGTRTITAMAAGTVTVSGGVVTTSAAHSIYLPIAADEEVYTVVDSNVVFGGGVASQWNVNGGLRPADGAVITSPGVLIRPSALVTGVRWADVRGRVNMRGTTLFRNIQSATLLTHLSTAQEPSFDQCAFIFGGLQNSRSTVGLRLTDCLFTGGTIGIQFVTASTDGRLDRCLLWGIGAIGVLTTTGGSVVITNSIIRECDGGVNVSSGGVSVSLESSSLIRNRGNGISLSANRNACSILNCLIANNGLQGVNTTSGAFRLAVIGGEVRNQVAQGVGSDTGSTDVVFRGTRIHSNATGVYIGSQGIRGACYAHYRTAATGDAGLIHQMMHLLPFSNDFQLRTGGLGFVTPGVWYTIPMLHVPGMIAYGAVTEHWTLNGGTRETQYRRSGDYGHTWSPWLPLPATITDVPDLHGECIQFRARRTDGGAPANQPVWSAVTVACTFAPNWTEPASWRGVHDVAATMRPQTIYQGGCVL